MLLPASRVEYSEPTIPGCKQNVNIIISKLTTTIQQYQVNNDYEDLQE